MLIAKEKNAELEEQEEKPLSTAGKIFSVIYTIFIFVLSAAILAGALLYAFSTAPDKSLFGYRYYTILTPSMSPTYNVGDLVFIQLKDGKDINKGDIITFKPSNEGDAYLTHRVTQKYENYEGTGTICFKTKGDANDSEDNFLIDESRVIGTVNFGIPLLGYVIRFFQLRWYIIVPVVVLLIVFFILLKKYFAMGKDDDEEDEEDGEKKGDDTESGDSKDDAKVNDGKSNAPPAKADKEDTDSLNEEKKDDSKVKTEDRKKSEEKDDTEKTETNETKTTGTAAAAGAESTEKTDSAQPKADKKTV